MPNLNLRSGSTNLGPSACEISLRPKFPLLDPWTFCRRGSSGRRVQCVRVCDGDVPCVPPIDGNLLRLRLCVRQPNS